MVTEPEPGFKSLVDRLEDVRIMVLVLRQFGGPVPSEALLSEHLAALDDAQEALEATHEPPPHQEGKDG